MNKSLKKLFFSGIIAGTSLSAFAAPDLSGYFDTALVSPKDKSSYFHQEHFNIMVQHQVDKFKFFAELEFEDTPNMDYGRVPVAGGAGTGGLDGGKGRIFLERAYGEYAMAELANLRMGQMLTPTYYYSNHYPSITLNYTRPLTFKTIFNLNIMGVQLFGEQNGFRYDLWVDRGPVTDTNSPYQNESGINYAGKLAYTYHTTKSDVTLALIGASYSLGNRPGNNARPHGADAALGAELQANYEKFTLLSEFGNRQLQGSTPTHNNQVMAYYVQGSYAFDLGKHGELSPFIMFDGLKTKEKTAANLLGDGTPNDTVEATLVRRTIVGLAYRPVPTVTWKLEYTKAGSYQPKNLDGTFQKLGDSSYVEDKVVAQFVYFYN